MALRRGQTGLLGQVILFIVAAVVVAVLITSLQEFIPTSGPLAQAVNISQIAILVAAVMLIVSVVIAAFARR